MRSAPEVARTIADAFESVGVKYALGGALSLGVWGFPRATNDVDVTVFVAHTELPKVFDALLATGCALDPDESRERVAERGDFVARCDRMRVDVFVPSIPFYESVESRIAEAPLQGRPAWFLSPEDLAVFKFLFLRTKDVLDVERLVALRTDFDDGYVRSSLVDLVGEDDERIARWDQLVRDVGSATTNG